jgi:outer membrane cobalamin receptor
MQRKLLSLSLVALLGVTSFSFAQEGKEVKLEDVVVTASRVEEKPLR